MRLDPGSPAPELDVPDVSGRPIRLSDYRSSRLMLSFYRFASCPFCNLRVHRLLESQADLAADGLHMIAVFQSSAENIRRNVGKQRVPFPIIADPRSVLYRRYGVERSRVAMVRAATLRLPEAALAMSKGFVPRDIDADVATVPADFLIDAGGIIRVAYYGRDIGDHVPLERVRSFARGC